MTKQQPQAETATGEAQDELWLKALKVFVVVTGIVLILGTSAFIYLFLNKRESDRAEAEARRFGPATPVEVPDGATIGEVLLENGRALVTLRGADERDYLLYVDLSRGERIGLVVLD